MTSISPSLSSSRPRVLVLYAHYNTRASYYDDWLDAFRTSSRFQIGELNICRLDSVTALRNRIHQIDLVVLLHSVNADHVFYLEPLAPILADRACGLVSFVGNEVNLPGAYISEKRRVLRTIGPNLVATQLLPDAGKYIWGDIASVISLPHALNPAAFKFQTPSAGRRLDIGMRSFRYPAVLGDMDRNRVLDWVVDWGVAHRLSIDVSNVRLDRSGWAAYLNDCRGTVSTEAGSWYLQRDDALVQQVLKHYQCQTGRIVLSARNTTLRKLAHRLPWRIRQGLATLFTKGPIGYEATALAALPDQELIAKFFAEAPRAPTYTKCISSRHFDAIGTGTVQILKAGRYNDILQADEHYIELATDLSNANEVARRFLDPMERNRIATRALEHVLSRHTYAHRIDALASHIGA